MNRHGREVRCDVGESQVNSAKAERQPYMNVRMCTMQLTAAFAVRRQCDLLGYVLPRCARRGHLA